jgi:hypothetical protein
LGERALQGRTQRVDFGGFQLVRIGDVAQVERDAFGAKPVDLLEHDLLLDVAEFLARRANQSAPRCWPRGCAAPSARERTSASIQAPLSETTDFLGASDCKYFRCAILKRGGVARQMPGRKRNSRQAVRAGQLLRLARATGAHAQEAATAFDGHHATLDHVRQLPGDVQPVAAAAVA